jgi:hypothetical protein
VGARPRRDSACGGSDPHVQGLELVEYRDCAPDLIPFAVRQRSQHAGVMQSVERDGHVTAGGTHSLRNVV